MYRLEWHRGIEVIVTIVHLAAQTNKLSPTIMDNYLGMDNYLSVDNHVCKDSDVGVDN